MKPGDIVEYDYTLRRDECVALWGTPKRAACYGDDWCVARCRIGMVVAVIDDVLYVVIGDKAGWQRAHGFKVIQSA